MALVLPAIILCRRYRSDPGLRQTTKTERATLRYLKTIYKNLSFAKCTAVAQWVVGTSWREKRTRWLMTDQQHRLGMPLGKPLEEELVQEFQANLRGELIRSEDDGYDHARAVFNGMVNKRPAMIVRCAGTSDVIEGVNFARTHTTCCFQSVVAGTASRARRGGMVGGCSICPPLKGSGGDRCD